MQTIQLEYQVNNHIYEEFLKNGKDIKDKIKEFILFELNIEDGYPTIGTAEAVEEYRSGQGSYLSEKEYSNRMNSFMEKLELKYGNKYI